MLTLALVFALIITSSSLSCAAGPDGVALYRAICAKCHNSLKYTTTPSRSFSRIKSAIRQNFGGMGSLNYLKDDELKAVADVLYFAGLQEDEADGRNIYVAVCSRCHKDLEHSDLKGKTLSEIQLAMKTGKCAESYIKKIVTEAEITKLADALKAGTKSKPGQSK